MLVWLSVWSKVLACIWPSWCHCHSLFLASVKSRLVLPFWYRLTWVVPEKEPLNGCVWQLELFNFDGCAPNSIKNWVGTTEKWGAPKFFFSASRRNNYYHHCAPPLLKSFRRLCIEHGSFDHYHYCYLQCQLPGTGHPRESSYGKYGLVWSSFLIHTAWIRGTSEGGGFLAMCSTSIASSGHRPTATSPSDALYIKTQKNCYSLYNDSALQQVKPA